ncbi:MAG: ATP-dependent RecD-like DNA helicase [Oscillospiraceae bacterium]|jgi:exodeoxyribonuclease V alpha subunit|nr:ATP-dependent RecD-like DNA helicase [Oscillospiraceae bacterium]
MSGWCLSAKPTDTTKSKKKENKTMLQDNKKIYEVTGEVTEVIYRNDENGYTVITIGGQEEELTAVGIMPQINVGEEIKLFGTFTNHHSYGRQFSVKTCERSLPSTVAGILRYLSTGAIKGVGPSTAARLVKEFGDKTLETIENNPQSVAKLKGISLEKAEDMANQLKQLIGIKELILSLGKYGISPNAVVSVWKQLGNSALKLIEENPYILCGDDLPVTFETADSIALQQNRGKTDYLRVRAGIVHVLLHNRLNGHTCLPKAKLAQTAAQFLEAPPEVVDAALENLVIDNTLAQDCANGQELIFMPKMYTGEQYIAARIKMFLRFPAPKITDSELKIAQIEQAENITYADHQKDAIRKALDSGLLVLTGGPGTGKTTTLNAIIKILKDSGQKVFLAAPTGRAAQRMQELTGCEAKTVHRLLEAGFDKNEKTVFKKNENNLLNCDALILDELSMIDVFLFESVTRALPMGCRLILVGDSNQLPSVGAGNVLACLINSGIVPTVELKDIFRQSMQSLIVTNAHKIVQGVMPDLSQTDRDFFFMPRKTPADITKTITELCTQRLPKTYGFSPMTDIQVLTPGRKGILGSADLNKHLQAAINPKQDGKAEATPSFNTYRIGDKVMQTKNNYNIPWKRQSGEMGDGIFNGDIGILKEINKGAKTLVVAFDDKLAEYDYDAAQELDLAYATTIHKSQGNEFNAVIIPMFRGAPQLMYRNLLYTGVTRAKKLLILVGMPAVAEAMVKNNRRTLRYSGLEEFLVRD